MRGPPMARKTMLAEFLQDESGATAVEYGLILGLVVLAVFVAMQGFATVAIDMWNDISTKSAEAVNGG